NGGPGDRDIVRGDSGTDTLSGGPGNTDLVSFASATRGAVRVNLIAETAKGDGHDKLSGFEDVVGSPQGDELLGDGDGNKLDGGVGDDELRSGGNQGEAFGGPGDDDCQGFTVENSCGPEPTTPPDGTYVVLNRGLDGSSLVVQGGSGDDNLNLGRTVEGWTVSDSGPIYAGDGCANVSASAVVCGGEPTLALIVITGGDGNDKIAIEPSIPNNAHVRANGNAGNDELIGGDGDDVLEAGENYNNPNNGNDRLEGNGGADVLYADPGADVLLGGPGNDLLVNAVPVCQGNTYDGGPGIDTVSYGRSSTGVDATLGGSGGPPGCGSPDRILGDNESLEGSDGADTLVGDNGPNSFLGHLGADTFIGKGGNDFIDSADDGARDKKIDCGPGGGEAITDKPDPKPINCN
ncbi:MAG: calcium-binding protein, partial [Solirubrobacterales bacterium]